MRVAVPLALVLVAIPVLGAPAPKEKARGGTMFLVNEIGLVYLNASGQQRERLERSYNGALSPDGRWLACLHDDEKGQTHSKLIIRPWDGKGDTTVVPDVSVANGEGCLPVWDADGKRLLVGESRSRDRKIVNTFRVYDLAAKKLTRLDLSPDHWVAGWSQDGKRLLSSLREGDGIRICWVNADGKGEPEFLTPEGELSYGPRPSPDGRRILFQAAQPKQKTRLYVMDLATKKRVALDEPGETSGYCWSPDGSRVAYTWQPTPVEGEEDSERVSRLITCDAAGGNRKVVTTRKYKPVNSGLHVVNFFVVVDWR